MKMRFLLTVILIMLLSFCNSTNAMVWYPITGESGAVQEIELDTIEIKNNDFVIYKTRKTKEHYTYVSKIQMDLKNKTFALLSLEALLNGKRSSYTDNLHNIQYKPINKGSSAEAVYNMLVVAKESPALDVKMKVWEKYFKKQQRIIQRSWHPNLSTNEYGTEPEGRAIAYVTLVLDKNGNILSREYQNNTNTDPKYDKFNKAFKKKIDNIFVKVPKFEPLPKEFNGKNIIVVLKFEYSYNHDAKTQNIKWEETGIGFLENGKNTSGWITCGKVLYCLVGIPLAIPFAIFNINILGWL